METSWFYLAVGCLVVFPNGCLMMSSVFLVVVL